MSEHLTAERISAVLDEPWSDMEAEAHLESCESCRGEYERFSRMRMALSALGELDPPPGPWEILEERLNVSPYLPPTDVVPSGPSGGWRGLRTRYWRPFLEVCQMRCTPEIQCGPVLQRSNSRRPRCNLAGHTCWWWVAVWVQRCSMNRCRKRLQH